MIVSYTWGELQCRSMPLEPQGLAHLATLLRHDPFFILHPSAFLSALRPPAQPVIDEHQRDHRLAHRHEARQQAGVVPAGAC